MIGWNWKAKIMLIFDHKIDRVLFDEYNQFFVLGFKLSGLSLFFRLF